MRFLIRRVKKDMSPELWQRVFDYLKDNKPTTYDVLSRAKFVEAIGMNSVVEVLFGFDDVEDTLLFKHLDKRELTGVLQRAFELYPISISVCHGDSQPLFTSSLLKPLMEKLGGQVFDLEVA